MKKIFLITAAILQIFIFPAILFPEHIEIYADLESVRKDGLVVIVCPEKLAENEYTLRINEMNAGAIKIISLISSSSTLDKKRKKLYKYIADVSGVTLRNLVKAGAKVVLVKYDFIEKKDFEYKNKSDYKIYKKEIITNPADTLMEFVKGGNCFVGSDDEKNDEYPRRMVYVDDFYIDKYEVSNRQFLIYVKESNSDTPSSWENGVFPQDKADFPALVTYYEAEAFAKWSGKRLPTEEEWEKAANGVDKPEVFDSNGGKKVLSLKKTIYPWGDEYSNICNDSSFWEKISGNKLDGKYAKGFLPVNYFDGKNISAYGAVNMAGNAAEWTSSWYDAYPGNKSYKNKRFGKQVKVIKGGSWFNKPYNVRNSSRGFAGLPSLYADSSVGFRCVKAPSEIDIE